MSADQVAAVLDREWLLTTGGRSSAAGKTFPVEDPSTLQVVAQVPDASTDDVDSAVAAGMQAATQWQQMTLSERSLRLRGFAAVLREHAEELALLDAVSSGNPRTAMQNDVAWAAEVIDLFADLRLSLGGSTFPLSAQNLHLTERVPFGVVARIVPFNHPILFAGAKVAAPLMAGNAVVLKPSELTPLSAIRMAELATEALPDGLLSVITGRGAETGQALVAHPAIKRIGFIGSGQVGRAIQRDAAQSGVKDISLELGGKNALIVCEDADPTEAADAAVRGMNFAWCQGQSCGSTSRVLVHESIAQEVASQIAAKVGTIRIGSPMSADTEMGPLVSRAQLDKSLDYLASAHAEGAELLAGGERPTLNESEQGYFLQPTVFGSVRPDMRIAKEEIFGPIMGIQTWRTEAEVLSIANSVDYGLTASVWTRDLDRALRLVRGLEVGYVWVNEVSRHFWGMPFGGMKQSGLGTEESVEELLSYTQLKSVNICSAR